MTLSTESVLLALVLMHCCRTRVHENALVLMHRCRTHAHEKHALWPIQISWEFSWNNCPTRNQAHQQETYPVTWSLVIVFNQTKHLYWDVHNKVTLHLMNAKKELSTETTINWCQRRNQKAGIKRGEDELDKEFLLCDKWNGDGLVDGIKRRWFSRDAWWPSHNKEIFRITCIFSTPASNPKEQKLSRKWM